MCFSLPTPGDPFNARHGNKKVQTKETKKREPLQVNKKAFLTGETFASEKGAKDESHAIVDNVEPIERKVIGSKTKRDKLITSTGTVQRSPINLEKKEIQLDVKGVSNGHQGQACECLDCPSKFLILCLNAIESALRHEGAYNVEEKPLFVNSFWRCYSSGKDILETSGSSSTIEQIAWIVSTAADNIARKDKEGFSFTSPFLLFLVPSQEKAAKSEEL